jgi:hypothetical protein
MSDGRFGPGADEAVEELPAKLTCNLDLHRDEGKVEAEEADALPAVYQQTGFEGSHLPLDPTRHSRLLGVELTRARLEPLEWSASCHEGMIDRWSAARWKNGLTCAQQSPGSVRY